MSWAPRRKWTYATVFVVLILLFVAIPIYKTAYVAPTCFDGVKNQEEEGIDCGGPCTLLCSNTFSPPKVVWTRFDQTALNTYNVGAYIVNPNTSGFIERISYEFSFYDEHGLLIATRKGFTSIPPKQNVLVFESAIRPGLATPNTAVFSFTEDLKWLRAKKSPVLVTTNSVLEDYGNGSLLTAEIKNLETKAVSNVEIGAIIYDKEENAIAFSRTVVDGIGPNTNKKISFTWPKILKERSARIEIIPVVRPYEL